MNFKEAKKQALALLLPFTPKHKRIKPFVGFEIESIRWSDCNHCRTPKEALTEAIREDKHAKKFGRKEKEK